MLGAVQMFKMLAPLFRKVLLLSDVSRIDSNTNQWFSTSNCFLYGETGTATTERDIFILRSQNLTRNSNKKTGQALINTVTFQGYDHNA